LLFAMAGIGLKTRDRQIAVIFEIEARRTKRFDKAGSTEGYWRLLVARAMGAGARRDADQHEPGIHGGSLLSTWSATSRGTVASTLIKSQVISFRIRSVA
jgi:hypothetical protein